MQKSGDKKPPEKMEKIVVSLDRAHWDIIEKEMDVMGGSMSSKARNIIVAYLSEHGYLDRSK